MTLATKLRDLSLEQAVNEGVALALAGGSVAEVAASLWSQGLDDDAVDVCGSVGLRDLIHARLAHLRRPVRDDEAAEALGEIEALPGRPVVNIHYAREHWQKVLAANYEVADGTRKALLAFTWDDSMYLREVAAGRAVGYQKLRDAMDHAAANLKKYRKPTIAQLPEKAQRQIAEALA